MSNFVSRVAVSLLLVVGISCGAGSGSQIGDGTGSGNGQQNDEDGSNTTGQSGGNAPDGGPSDGGDIDRNNSCAVIDSQASLKKRPVDIIFVIDNSGSMTQEIQGVERNINQNFSDIISASGLDYRVIMLSKHGSATASQSICVAPPLSGNATCNPVPATHTNGTRFFQNSIEIGSHDAWDRIVGNYGGYSSWLRADALKIFVVITDDNPDTRSGFINDAAEFESGLFALTPAMFGNAAKRNYIFHTIAGFAGSTTPWQPADPIQTSKCDADSIIPGNGSKYQELSQLTGGLRFPICQHANFDVVFQKIAEGVVEGSSVACQYAIPTAPPGRELSKYVVRYTPQGTGTPQTFEKVSGAGACGANNFYVENNSIKLCPTTCNTVSADAAASVEVLFTCDVMIN